MGGPAKPASGIKVSCIDAKNCINYTQIKKKKSVQNGKKPHESLDMFCITRYDETTSKGAKHP
ncbi:hypothetical protein DC3_47310 [Deinococcus cellulosilyticus NBRC 106333 = KACC 11606]|uniref:Uncharacterized protein n=1 Tax=Deinococcus cellulosilyticus (strain DSM 18568 / NBRC 106333 / KACC 11606 / 5516J-15) TaxID=1223518 RepID=A0A511N9A8_DEIC1|nr:hypothetical protein DC3_47310 [Deinococcus cellulosilyticus NBRC 106333 = KACC 11606]